MLRDPGIKLILLLHLLFSVQDAFLGLRNHEVDYWYLKKKKIGMNFKIIKIRKEKTYLILF